MASTVPVALEVGVKGAQASAQQLENVAKSASRIGTVAAGVTSRLGAMFAAGAVSAFARQSLGFTAGLKDISDQFSISASEAYGFAKQITDVGGSTQKAVSILGKLQQIQEETNDPRTLSEFIESIRQSYEETGNFGEIIELVGTKNAPVFAAALREMSGGLENFRNASVDAAAASSDAVLEEFQTMWDKALVIGAQSSLGLIGGIKGAYRALFTAEGDTAAEAFWSPFVEMNKKAKDAADSINKVNEALAESRRISGAKSFLETELARLADETKAASDWWKQREQEAAKLYKIPDRLIEGGRTERTDSFRFDNAEAMGSQSSAAVVNFQKFQAAQQSTESKQLTVMSNIERYAKQTADNTRDADVVQVIDESDFQ